MYRKMLLCLGVLKLLAVLPVLATSGMTLKTADSLMFGLYVLFTSVPVGDVLDQRFPPTPPGVV